MRKLEFGFLIEIKWLAKWCPIKSPLHIHINIDIYLLNHLKQQIKKRFQANNTKSNWKMLILIVKDRVHKEVG
jgi:hypothetical protein